VPFSVDRIRQIPNTAGFTYSKLQQRVALPVAGVLPKQLALAAERVKD
jgi:hypothetical protein